MASCRLKLCGSATGFRLLGGRLWCQGSDTSRGNFLLLGRCGFFYEKWEWTQRPEDNGPGSRGRPVVQRVAEKDDAYVLLLLKHELVLVFIEGNGQRSFHC